MSDPYQAIAKLHGLSLTEEHAAKLADQKVQPTEFLGRILLLEALERDDDVRRRVAEVIWPKPSRWERFRRAVLR